MADDPKDPLHPKYPHLENLDRVPYVLDATEVYITEKIHGFNARFGRTPDGNPWVGSRNNVVDPETTPLQGFTDWAMRRVLRLPPGTTVFGEWAGKGIQKGIDYGAPRFYLFAVLDQDRAPVDPERFVDWAELLDCTTVPLLYVGPPPPMTALDMLRKGQSLLAEQPREGIVIVPWPPVTDPWGHTVIAKFKHPDFEERAHARREAPAPPDLSTVTAFVEEYATDERLSHVLDQLAEDGLDGLDRVNTGALLRAYYHDVIREGAADHEQLDADSQKLVGKVLNEHVKTLVAVRREKVLVTA